MVAIVHQAPSQSIVTNDEVLLIANNRSKHLTTKYPEYEKYRPHFGYQSAKKIEATFKASTQYGSLPNSELLRKRYKAPNPMLNIPPRNEPVATDTVFSDTPAVDGGETCSTTMVRTTQSGHGLCRNEE